MPAFPERNQRQTTGRLPEVVVEDEQVREATIGFPGYDHLLQISYSVLDNLAIFEGDLEIDDLLPAEKTFRPGKIKIHGKQGSTPISISSGRVSQDPLVVIKNQKRRWSGGIIPYSIHKSISTNVRTLISGAITEYHNKTNIKFVPYDSKRHDKYVLFKEKNFEDTTCGTSGFGRPRRSRRTIRLDDTNVSKDCVIHEIGHTLGLYHEQARMDRDDFVTVHFDRIEKGKSHNFKKHVSDAIDVGPYDCDSIMHYSKSAFRKDGVSGDTITSANPSACPSVGGPTGGLSVNDIKGLNVIYPIADCNDAPILFNGKNFEHDAGSLVVRSDRRRLKSLDFNDKTSSMCIPSGWSLTVYKDIDYKGTSKRFGPGTYRNLDDQKWNDKISSVKVTGPYEEEIPEECNTTAMLFEHDTFLGRSLRVQGNIPELGSGTYRFNNLTDSLCVPPDTTVHLFTKSNYKGKTSLEIVGGSEPMALHDLKNYGPGGDDWHDVVSSVKIIK